MASSDAWVNDPRWAQCTYWIADVRNAHFGGISIALLQQLAKRNRELAEKTPDMYGVVITHSKLVRGLLNVYFNWHRAMGGIWDTAVVTSEAEARAVLGQSPVEDNDPPLEGCC